MQINIDIYLSKHSYYLNEIILLTMSLKIRANNFCPDECELLVDLVQENKQKPFWALSSFLTTESPVKRKI